MEIINHYHRTLQLPSGLVLEPNVKVFDPRWAYNQKSHGVKVWLRDGIIEAIGDDAGSQTAEVEATTTLSEEDAIRAELKKLGVTPHHKAGLEKLREALEKAQAEKEEAERVEGDADLDSEEDIDEDR